jgi:hypothetical protein
MYLTPYTKAAHEALVDGRLGLLITPQSHRPAQYTVADFAYWAADNGCFTLGARFDLGEYLTWLSEEFTAEEKALALFAPAPDVVGDWDATLARSTTPDPVVGISPLDAIREVGFPAAIVLQDGASIDTVPWDDIDAVFVGGSTEWKLGPDVAVISEEAEARGKWVHMGRVNSRKRIRLSVELGAHSVDGTYALFGPSINVPKLDRWTAEAGADYGYAEAA